MFFFNYHFLYDKTTTNLLRCQKITLAYLLSISSNFIVSFNNIPKNSLFPKLLMKKEREAAAKMFKKKKSQKASGAPSNGTFTPGEKLQVPNMRPAGPTKQEAAAIKVSVRGRLFGRLLCLFVRDQSRWIPLGSNKFKCFQMNWKNVPSIQAWLTFLSESHWCFHLW